MIRCLTRVLEECVRDEERGSKKHTVANSVGGFMQKRAIIVTQKEANEEEKIDVDM